MTSDKLEGMGTNLGNKIKGAYGNYDDLLISISSLTNNVEDKRFSNTGEFENYVFNVVEPKKIKNRKAKHLFIFLCTRQRSQN